MAMPFCPQNPAREALEFENDLERNAKTQEDPVRLAMSLPSKVNRRGYFREPGSPSSQRFLGISMKVLVRRGGAEQSAPVFTCGAMQVFTGLSPAPEGAK
jgi:hypothetical protein